MVDQSYIKYSVKHPQSKIEALGLDYFEKVTT